MQCQKEQRRESSNISEITWREIDKWHLCKAGGFSYSESSQTPPLEALGDLEPVYHRFTSLFTTSSQACLPPVHKCITLTQSVTHVDYTPNSTLRREEP